MLSYDDYLQKAQSIIKIPDSYQLLIEEVPTVENVLDEACFIWMDEHEENGVIVKLDRQGHLLRVSNDIRTLSTVQLNEQELMERAQSLLLTHYPSALIELTFTSQKWREDRIRFEYERYAYDILLESCGVVIELARDGEMVSFVYNQMSSYPDKPSHIVDKEIVLEEISRSVVLKPVISPLYAILHHVDNDSLRLLYRFSKYPISIYADHSELSWWEESEDEGEEKLKNIVWSKKKRKTDVTIEEIVGISLEEMEVIREVDHADGKGIVWRDKEWQPVKEPKSFDTFFRNRSEETVKAIMDPKTDRLRSFVWFKEREGDLCLDKQRCLEKAIEFIELYAPEYTPYLLYKERDEELLSVDEETVATFLFSLHNGTEIPVELSEMLVSINRKNGQVEHYMSPTIDLDELLSLPRQPTISKEQAKEIWMEHLDVELKWRLDYGEDNQQSFKLVYEAYERKSGHRIQYIDALTGEMITQRD
ncbi:YcdB/YcdC domain-containing protein [Alkalihalobacillus pseudalcaliphilus]|uniref:YcdB/YcdC domain-containing protein n=1 Tax=Alkalihalobacillus pseudalcaliphilus TaxID=79884 RepID=UPI00064DD50D|nr:YcdB/YcdC domain-containing protein [Alkalihalobacillus pseudalcaliphilus]KMK75143.1 hypothetical protein AB990_17000 [Alkalihalobacillus pseudalcaliphilus]